MLKLEKALAGGDLRSIGKSQTLVSKIDNQADFDKLFKYLFHSDRIVRMRAIDSIEKITINKPALLRKHEKKILLLCKQAKDKEIKWHLALLIPRLQLDRNSIGECWDTLTKWAKDKTNSRIVRVNSIQALFELSQRTVGLKQDFVLTMLEIETENIPSLNARIKKIKYQLNR